MTALVVAFDTEFARDYGPGTPLQQRANQVLCYSLAVANLDTGQTAEYLEQLPDGKGSRPDRPTFAQVIGQVLVKARLDGLFTTRPEELFLVAHFTRADLPAFRDWKRLRRKFDGVRKTYITVVKPAWSWYPLEGTSAQIKTFLIDTMLLAPAGAQSLAALGDLLGIPKIKLPRGAIEDMARFRQDQPELFRTYALRDAIIARDYWRQICLFLEEELGIDQSEPTPTLGAAAVKLLRNNGYTWRFSGYVRGPKGRDFHPELAPQLGTFANAYHGARNECFEAGVSKVHPIYDIDIVAAYSTAMTQFKVPDWDRLVVTTELDQLCAVDGLAVAQVAFKFPSTVRFPSLPVSAGNRGLTFPRTGISFCTNFDLLVARNLGAELAVKDGVWVPFEEDSARPVASFSAIIRGIRRRYPKGSLLERLAKEIGNSLYGKFAQGVAGMKTVNPNRRRVFNTREGQMQDLPLSSITSPPIAAATTGLVRALLSELINGIAPHHAVYSATTDGFLTSCPLQEIDTSGPMAQLYKGLCQDAYGSDAILELKHGALQIIAVKTRGTFTAQPYPGLPPVLARAGGQHPDAPFDDPMAESAAWCDLYRHRDYETSRQQRSLVSLREQWENVLDLVEAPEVEVRMGFDYDFKRRPLEVSERDGLLHITTAPWETLEEFHEFRDELEHWKKQHRRVLRTRTDWNDFVGWRSRKVRMAQGGSNVRLARPLLVQRFLRCWARRAYGLPGGHYRDLAEVLTAAGWPTKEDDVKQARRRGGLDKVSLDLDAEERRFLAWAVQQYPTWEVDAFLPNAAAGSGDAPPYKDRDERHPVPHARAMPPPHRRISKPGGSLIDAEEVRRCLAAYLDAEGESLAP